MRAAITALVLALAATALPAEPPQHDKVLYTQVRVRVATAEGQVGGSGTVVYSGPTEGKKDAFSTYVLTCQHVVEAAVRVDTFFDPTLGRERKRELRQEVEVEFFDYGPDGSVDRTYSVRADVAAHDALHDLALLRLKSNRRADYVAEMFPRGESARIRIGHPVVAVGCALLHDPIRTEGTVTHKGDVINYNEYWMSNAQIIYGNSGGAVFTGDTGQFIGVPSRIAVAGWSTPVTHLGYFSPVDRVYKFIDDQGYEFLYNRERSEAECEKAREERKRKAQEKQ